MISESVVSKDYLAEHQWKALRKLANGKILKGGVGTGKSRVAAAYYKIHEAPKHVYVITTARKRDELDWVDEFLAINVYPKPGSGLREPEAVLGDGDRSDDVRGRVGFDGGAYPFVLTVDSWNNIAKYAEVAGAFFIFDEQRLVGSGSWSRKFLKIAKHNNWILLTATPGDTWLDYVPVFVANNFYKNRTAFNREHVVYSPYTKYPKVDRYVGQGKLLRQRAKLLVEMPYLRATTPHPVEVLLPYDKEALDVVLKERWHIYEERPLKDVAEMFTVARRVVNGDPSRLHMVEQLWTVHPRLIVFYNFNYELYSLRSLISYYDVSNTSSESSQAQGSGTKTRKNASGSSSTTRNVTSTGGVQLLESTSTSQLSIPTTGCIATSQPIDGTKSENRTGKKNGNSSVAGKRSALQIVESTAPVTVLLEEKNGVKNRSLTSESNRDVLPADPLGQPKIWTPTSQATEWPVTNATTAIAEWNGHKHESVPTTDRWLYLVQYSAGNEAWNCITTDAMILYSQNYSWKVREQSKGRIDRLNTPFKDLWYYEFTSNSWIDKAIARSLLAKETFNASKYADMFK